MSRTQPLQQFRRARDLRAIRDAVAAIAPQSDTTCIHLEHIAVIVKARSACRPRRCFHDVRDQILTIATEWDLTARTLDQQPDECLATLAAFLR